MRCQSGDFTKFHFCRQRCTKHMIYLIYNFIRSPSNNNQIISRQRLNASLNHRIIAFVTSVDTGGLKIMRMQASTMIYLIHLLAIQTKNHFFAKRTQASLQPTWLLCSTFATTLIGAHGSGSAGPTNSSIAILDFAYLWSLGSLGYFLAALFSCTRSNSWKNLPSIGPPLTFLWSCCSIKPAITPSLQSCRTSWWFLWL